MQKLYTTVTAAAKLGISPTRVRKLISDGRLEAMKSGRDWLIDPKALNAIAIRKTGRPRKEEVRNG